MENSYLVAVKDRTGNTTYDVTYRSKRKDGVIRWQRAAGYVMWQANGSPITCYGLVMDVNKKNDISGVRVLLVEDNDLNMEIAETFLKDAGAIVTKAYNGQQAVYTFTQNRPHTFDVILRDVMMPLMNRYEATRKIRSLDLPDAKTIPIIAMTANAFVEDIQEAKEAEMTEHLAKPLDIAKVIATISKCLNR